MGTGFWQSNDFLRLLFSALSSLLEYLLAAFLFAIPMRRKRFFALRLLGCLAIYLASAVLIAVFRSFDTSYPARLVTTVYDYLLPLPLLLLCFSESVPVVTIHWCAGIAAGEAGIWLINLFLTALGVDIYSSITIFPNLPRNNLRDWLIYFAMHLLIYVLLFLLLGRTKLPADDPKRTKSVARFAAVSVLCMSVFISLSREFRNNSDILFTVSMLYNLILCVLLLLLRAGILFRARAQREMELMERVLSEERKQYESVKASMDVINMKCHDLKHQLSDVSAKLTEAEVTALKDAIAIYDSSIKTGNEVLDVLIYEKQLVCQREQISLSCMANGKLLSFMSTAHTYALFNNAIGNAIEAVQKLTDPEKRQISVSVACEAQDVVVEVANYYNGAASSDTLDTSKPDRNHHGFGTKSIRYITEQYGGSVTMETENGMFVVSIRFPNRRS